MTDFITLSHLLNQRNSYLFIYLKFEKGTPFGRSLPVQDIKGCTPRGKSPFLYRLEAVRGEDEKENDSPKFCWRGGGGSTQATIDDYVGMRYSFFQSVPDLHKNA